MNDKNNPKKENITCFSFGGIEVVDDYLDLLTCYDEGDYYNPPVNLNDLTKLATRHVNAHHRSALQTKKNVLVSTFQPTPILSVPEFEKFVMSYLTLGNAYFEVVYNRLGEVMQLKNLPAKFMRVASKKSGYYLLRQFDNKEFYPQKRVYHLKEYDLNQEVYGIPYYLGALGSINLNKSGTIFRQRYYDNGAHAGFILYLSDPNIHESDYDDLKEELGKTKGGGNFKNILLRVKNGNEKGIQLLPIADIAAKDEFLNIKNVSRDDILAAHRVPPQLMGIVPNNTGGFGDIVKAAAIFATNEIYPIQRRILELNDVLGMEAVRFLDYEIKGLRAE